MQLVEYQSVADAEVALSITLVLVCLKTYSMTRGLLWVWWRGDDYRAILTEHPPETRHERESAIAAAGGDFFPFGSKAYRLQHIARAGHGIWSRVIRFPIRIALTCWRYPVFVLIVAAFLIFVAQRGRARTNHSEKLVEMAGASVGLLLMLGSIILAAEAFLSIMILGSYGASIHAGTLQPKTHRKEILVEMQALVGALFTAHLSAVGTMYYLSTRIEVYGRLSNAIRTPSEIAQKILDCSYYALSTMLGTNDPDPQGPIGKVATALIGLQGFSLLFIVLGAILSPASVPQSSRNSPPDKPSKVNTSGLMRNHSTLYGQEGAPEKESVTRSAIIATAALAAAASAVYFIMGRKHRSKS